MSRPKSTLKKSRLTLELAVPVRERLEELRARTGAESVTEVIRRAVAFYDAFLGVEGDGAIVSIVVKHKDGREEGMLIPSGYI